MKPTEEELVAYRKMYDRQAAYVVRRKPDANGHVIKFNFTFEEWLAVWIESGKLHLRGRGAGKFCMARKNDLGDYEVGNTDIKSWEENSREAKLGKPGLKGRVSPTKGIDWKPETRRKRKLAALNRPELPCPHCGGQYVAQALARYHGDKCQNAPAR